jgi:hypothetical protein
VRFLGTFLLTAGLMAFLYGAAMRLIDPRVEFGTGLIPGVGMNSRVQKVPLFEKFNAAHRTGGLLLGSSRAMRLDPAQWEADLHEPVFNFGVEYARAEDYLAIYRWVRRQAGPPRYLVLGLDVDALDNNDLPDKRFANSEEFKHLADEAAPGWWERAADAAGAYHQTFTASYAWDALRCVKRAVRRYEVDRPRTELRADGSLSYIAAEAERARGTFSLKFELTLSCKEYLLRFEDMTGLSERRQRYVETLIDEARRDGATVKVWLTPLHPRVTEALAAATKYPQLLAQTRDFLRHLGADCGAEVYDFSEPALFGGSLTGWYDGSHMDGANAALVTAAMTERGR